MSHTTVWALLALALPGMGIGSTFVRVSVHIDGASPIRMRLHMFIRAHSPCMQQRAIARRVTVVVCERLWLQRAAGQQVCADLSIGAHMPVCRPVYRRVCLQVVPASVFGRCA